MTTENKLKITIDELLKADKEQLRKWFEHKKGRYKGEIHIQLLLKTGILSEIERCKHSNVEERLIRGYFWYHLFKVILSNIYPEKIKEKKFRESITFQIYHILSNLVLEGKCSYEELKFFDQAMKSYKTWEAVYENIIIVIEDDDTYLKVKNMAKLFDVSIISCSGRLNTQTIEYLAKYINSDEIEHTVFFFTDYDHYGFDIVRDGTRRMKKLGLKIKDSIRVGINPKHVFKDIKNPTTEEIRIACYKLPLRNTNEKIWAAKNGINGELGIEIQALKNKKIREILVDELLKYCPEKLMYEKWFKEKIEWSEGAIVEEIVDEETKELTEKIESKEEEIREETEPLQEELSELTSEKEDLTQEVTNKIIKVIEEQGFEGLEIKDGTLRELAINNKDWYDINNIEVTKWAELIKKRYKESD